MNEDKKKGKDFVASKTAEGVIIIAFAGACYLLGCLTSWSFDFKEWNTFSFINSSFLFVLAWLFGMMLAFDWPDKHILVFCLSYVWGLVCYLIVCFFNKDLDATKWSLSDICTSGVIFAFVIEKFYWEFHR